MKYDLRISLDNPWTWRWKWWCPTQPIDVFIKVANGTAAPEPGIFLAVLVSVAGEIMSQQSLPTLELSSALMLNKQHDAVSSLIKHMLTLTGHIPTSSPQ